MNYFQHHIGDYRRDTGHLSLLEHGVYRQLIDLYYLSEEPIPAETEWVIRRLSARTDEEISAIHAVLKDFFIDGLDGKPGYSHKRCDAELREYAIKAGTARVNGKLGGRPKKTQPVISGNQDVTTSQANHEPLTINQEPKEEKTPAAPAFVLPEWIPADTWAAYLQTRKAKKAKNEPHALGLIVGDLADIRNKGHDPIVVLNNSIKSGWAGVFEPKTLGTFAQAKADVAKCTVSLNPDVEATRRRVEADAAIPRNGPTLAVLAQMAALRGQRQAA